MSGILRSAFSYQKEALPDEVLRLFTGMLDKPTKNVEYTQEIIDAAQQGRINLQEDFNLEGYCYRISQNLKMKESKHRAKETFYFEDDGVDDSQYSTYAQQGGVSLTEISANRFNALEQGFEMLEDSEEFLCAVDTIKSLREDFLVSEGVDLVMLIKHAMEFFPQAIEKLKSICEEFELVGEQIEIILSSGKNIEDYFEFA